MRIAADSNNGAGTGTLAPASLYVGQRRVFLPERLAVPFALRAGRPLLFLAAGFGLAFGLALAAGCAGAAAGATAKAAAVACSAAALGTGCPAGHLT